MGNRLNGPPELMPWLRATDERLSRIERAQAQLGGVPTQSYAVSADSKDAVASPLGTTPSLMLMQGQPEPSIDVVVTGGQVKITVSAYMEATRNAITAAYATGIFRASMSVTGDSNLSGGRATIGVTGGGLIKTFNYATGQGGPMGESVSHSRTIKVPNGRYSIHSEYVYFHSNASIGIRWSQCSITAEPI